MTSPDGWSGGHDSGWDDMGDMARIFGEFLTGPLSKIAQGIFNAISEIFGKGDRGLEGLKEFVDGQLELNERTDLLSPLLDYGSVYMDAASQFVNVGQMQFNHKIGPMKGCSMANNSIYLDSPGLWDIRAQLWFDWTLADGNVQWQIRIYKPDNTLYSVMRAEFDSKAATSSTNLCSVVIKDGGYVAQVWVSSIGAGRGVLGGPSRNRLTVQHISHETNIGDTGEGA